MSLPASDAFTNTDGVIITTHNASFSLVIGGLYILSNALQNAAASQAIGYWNADSFSADQYCQMTAAGVSGTATQWFGPACRVLTTGAETCYFFNWGKAGAAQRRYGKRIAGSNTVLSNDNTAATPGDVFKLQCVGTTITALINGGTWNSTTDSAISAADPAGIYSQGGGTANLGDDFLADNYSAGHPAARRFGRRVAGQDGVRIF